MRKVRTAYAGAAIRVLRNSDNAQADIGFTSAGDLDIAAANAFGSNLKVVKIYDQSGAGLDLPGVAPYHTLNVAGALPSVDGGLPQTNSRYTSATTKSLSAPKIFSVYEFQGTSENSYVFDLGNYQYYLRFQYGEVIAGNNDDTYYGVSAAGVRQTSLLFDTGSDILRRNGTAIAATSGNGSNDAPTANQPVTLLSYSGGFSTSFIGRWFESIFFDGAISNANRDAIEADQIYYWLPGFKITTASPLPDATVGRTYSQTIQTSGGGAGALDFDLVDDGGTLGTITSGGVFSFNPTAGMVGTPILSLVVYQNGASAFKDFAITINPAVSITSAAGALTGGSVGTVYSGVTSTRNGGTANYIWSISSGSLPNGLSLDANGKPVGTPTTAGTFAFTRRVTDANGSFAEQSHTIAIVAPASPPPTASFTKSASSGNAPLTVSFSDTSTGTPTAWSWNFGDGNTSTAQNPLHTFGAPGTYTVTLSASNSSGSTQTTQTIIVTEAAALPLGFNRAGLELLVIPNEMTPTNGTNAGSLTDYTDYARHLTAASGYPTFQTGVQNSKAIVRFSGSNNPLKNAATFSVACGWMVVKHTGVTFGDFEGVLSGLGNVGILVGGGASATTFFDFLDDYYEYRLNDRIYPKENAPAPMGDFKLIFFRFWRPITIDGVQIGQDRTFTTRKFTGDIGLLALSSRNFCEKEIRAQSQRIADYFALTLADVIPYQGMKSDEVISGRVANVYDPPEGNRIVEVIGNYNQSFNLTFGNRSNKEFKAMREYHKGHYPIPETAYRDYNVLPPEDVEGYIDSPLRKSGATNNISYSFSFKGK